MYRLHVENTKGEKIELTNSPYWYAEIEGVTPGKATINRTTLANSDGSTLNNARKEDRDITITVFPKMPIEDNRQRLYRYFKTKRKVTIFLETENRNVKTEGYVESIDGSLFEQTQSIEIGVICLNPYFEEAVTKSIAMTQMLDLFEFPFAIAKEGQEFSRIDKMQSQNVENDGDVETGVIIEMEAVGQVINPTIFNTETREYFGLNIEMQLGDAITVNTNMFKKRVTLKRGGEEKNIINHIIKGNTWFELSSGDNIFTYQCEKGEENLNVKFLYANKYEGV